MNKHLNTLDVTQVPALCSFTSSVYNQGCLLFTGIECRDKARKIHENCSKTYCIVERRCETIPKPMFLIPFIFAN